MENLPALQVVIPLLAAPLCFLIRHPMAVRVFAVGVTWCSLMIAWLLLYQVLDTGVIVYEFGGWPRPPTRRERMTWKRSITWSQVCCGGSSIPNQPNSGVQIRSIHPSKR